MVILGAGLHAVRPAVRMPAATISTAFLSRKWSSAGARLSAGHRMACCAGAGTRVKFSADYLKREITKGPRDWPA